MNPAAAIATKLPDWFDTDLHGAALNALTDEFVSPSAIKPALGEWSDRTYQVLRELCELGLAERKVEKFKYFGETEGSRSYFRRAVAAKAVAV